MNITLNIGLVTNTGQPVNFESVATHLVARGFKRDTARIEQSSTEPTLVWSGTHESIQPDVVLERLYSLAVKFEQDCIAARLSIAGLEASALVGPDAAKWGPFNAEFFITP